MKSSVKKITKRFLIIIFLLLVAMLYFKFDAYMSVPKEKLSLSEYYPEMPPDSKNIYIDLPIDYNNITSGKYRGFYRLSPNFTPGKDIIFYLTDGQQNKVHTKSTFDLFEEKIPNLSYVVMGRRGSSPSLFPEVYTSSNNVDYKKAMNLYGTDQQIEDIEMVRQDLQEKGYLRPDGKIMLFGGSGGGVLVQQYLAKYGQHVYRAMLEATSAPDIIMDNTPNITGLNFNIIMNEKNPESLEKLKYIITTKKVDSAQLCYMIFKISVTDIDWIDTCSNLIDDIYKGNKKTYYENLFNPEYNFSLCKIIMKSPIVESTKVRMFELCGDQLLKYSQNPNSEVNICFEWSKELLKDYLNEAEEEALDVPNINLLEDRKKYKGEMLFLIGNLDIDFSINVAKEITQSYSNSKMIIVNDTHSMTMNEKKYQDLRTTFFTEGLFSDKLLNIINDINID
ncbi:hypothetical protein [Clostridium intestinale]|uniref:Uncharacterized protein n=2 Tax=Clostridium intestinale TaxID=36845 RepID=U2NPV6_9CLOT|nr:hypothetical protein [Clostridium intestinale]ERK31208.1 hypothetical protein CINTURNW_1927 [Clostridium intestinale URNW]QLY82200.1 hypothetical protein HZF06_11600 [Clostridium intestinale]